MNAKITLPIAGVVVALIALYSCTYTVGQWQIAIITQFGKIVGEPILKPGLHFKIPMVQDVRYFDRRILSWDGEPSLIPTQGKYILVDTTARWRISDPRKFIETVQNEGRAERRITSILEGKTKNIITRYPLVDTVRNTNAIIEKVKKRETQKSDEDAEMVTGEIDEVTVGREQLQGMITTSARPEINELGIELIDVLIRRVAYEPSVEKKVFSRMISERNRIAEKIRSVGKGEKAKIQGKLNLDLKTIESRAYRTAKKLRGDAEGQATKIYADALNQAPEFYEFTKTLEAYKKTMPEKGRFLLSTDSRFFQLLKEGGRL